MSDRFVLDSSKEEVEQVFGVTSQRDDFFDPKYNISPGGLVPVVFTESDERKILKFYWGLIPEDADSEQEGKPHFEYPMEELGEDEWVDACFEQRRCLIPASGFYKWKTSKKKNTPFYIRLLNNRVMAFAGVYSVWKADSGRELHSCTMLTTEANVLVQPVSDRMPVIIRRENYAEWLGEKSVDSSRINTMLKPYQLTEMAVNRVSEDVNDINASGPELIQPIPK